MRSQNRFAATLALGALAALVSLSVLAQDRGAIETAVRPAAASAGPAFDRDPLADLIHCLRVLNLTEAQKTAIHQFLEAEKPTLQSLHDTLVTDRRTLETDASATPPDPCKVGTDFLKVVADREAIRAEIGKIRDFIESQLTAEQKARFEGCLVGSRSGPAAGPTHP